MSTQFPPKDGKILQFIIRIVQKWRKCKFVWIRDHQGNIIFCPTFPISNIYKEFIEYKKGSIQIPYMDYGLNQCTHYIPVKYFEDLCRMHQTVFILCDDGTIRSLSDPYKPFPIFEIPSYSATPVQWIAAEDKEKIFMMLKNGSFYNSFST